MENRNATEILPEFSRLLYDNSLAYRRLQALQRLLDPTMPSRYAEEKDETAECTDAEVDRIVFR